MTTKKYLEQINRFDKMIQNKKLEIEVIATNATKITVPTDSENVKSSGNKDKIGTLGTEIAMLSSEIDKLLGKRRGIIRQIEGLEDAKQYEILFWYFVLHKTNDEIAAHNDCSTENITKIKRNAMKNFERKYGEAYL